MSVPRFESSELQQALASVGWGLQAWELLPEHFCPQNEARAKVELLEEGDTAVVSVSQAGWKVVLRSVADFSRLPADSASDDQTFETVENLLAYLSPKFEQRRMTLLTERLEDVAVSRKWQGEDADDGGAAQE